MIQTTAVSRADVKPSCDEVLHTCILHVNAQEKYIELLKEQGKELVKERDEAIELARENTGSILPWYGWAGIGFLLGGITIIGVQK